MKFPGFQVLAFAALILYNVVLHKQKISTQNHAFGELQRDFRINAHKCEHLQGGEPFFSGVVVQVGTSQLELMVYFHLSFSAVCVKAKNASYILQMLDTTSRISKEK